MLLTPCPPASVSDLSPCGWLNEYSLLSYVSHPEGIGVDRKSTGDLAYLRAYQNTENMARMRIIVE